MKTIEDQCKQAHEASTRIALLPSDKKNHILSDMAQAILDQTQSIVAANKKDMVLAKENGLSASLLDRLALTPERIIGISESISTIEKLKDPNGTILDEWTRPNGLKLQKVSVPLGVIGMIYEARPNVTADAIALCIKTGNCIVLRGSSSAYQSNKIISDIMKAVLSTHDAPEKAIQLLENTSREGVSEFVQMNQYLNLIIPRGGASLIQNVIKTATVPTIETGVGNCHTYVDQSAQEADALRIIINAKTQRPSVCCACESVLVHHAIATQFLPKMISELQKLGVECRGCSRTQNIVPSTVPATEEDWGKEYNDLIISIKVVDSTQEAINHINTYGTTHSEAILSESESDISSFTQQVDAAAVLVNTSTRFVDGGEFGFGAEIGISTQKLHARGPMGLPELMSYKYIVIGNGQIRE